MTGINHDKRGTPRPSLAHRLEYTAFSSIRWLFERLTVPQAASLSAFFWRLIAPYLRRHRRAESNLKAALPNLSESARKQILTRMWDNLGRTSAEAFHLHGIADADDAIELNLTSDAQRILNSNHPAIFVSLHLGNWEVTAIAAERFNKPLMGIYKRVENPFVDQAIIKLRSRFYVGGLHSRGPDTVKNILAGIKSGYSIAVMGDLRDSHGEAVPFFGQPSRSTNFPALLARRYNVPIVVIRAVRTSPGHFRIDADQLVLTKTYSQKEDMANITKCIQSQFEKWIREDPSLWMWGHRRW